MRCAKCLLLKMAVLFLIASKCLSREIALIEQLYWPKNIESKIDFDSASRAEILLFYKTIQEELKSKNLSKNISVEQDKIDYESIKKWSINVQEKLVNLYKTAAKSCSHANEIACSFSGDHKQFLKYAQKFYENLDAQYIPWKKASSKFYKIYAREQIRLAAIFNRVSSEVFSFNDSEILGDKFNDGEFLFTMDDGPEFDQINEYTQLLTSLGISGMFFVIGDKLSKTIKNLGFTKVNKIYSKHCIGSHGKIHKPHPKIKNWKESIETTEKIIKKINSNQKIYFRPPFGERNSEILAFANEKKMPIMLWNIDSLDWNELVSPTQLISRVEKLMLLWRRGILLFHDDRLKALGSVKAIDLFVKNNDLKWLDCSKTL
ncbi:MAG: polysaccharide deacetylase family protein [Halobacteriovoraceae bacterium]|nr:polysaccharide deacetylase family protein [Halobacteriovoraceae bacterium]